MNDSADIKMAVDRLQRALGQLESALDPLLIRVEILEKTVDETEAFTKDRAELAQKLDQSLAKEQEFEKREAEFAALADETTSELDQVIRQVRTALEQAE